MVAQWARRWSVVPTERHHQLHSTTVDLAQPVVDEARRIARQGHPKHRITLAGLAGQATGGEVDLLELDVALERLREADERWARIVELRFFGGLSGEEVAQALGLSRRTVTREWTLARAWLKRALG